MGNTKIKLKQPDFNTNPSIETRRKLLIKALFVQVLSSIVGIVIATRICGNSFLIAMNFLSLFLTGAGFIGSCCRQKYYIGAHSMGTFCFMGGLFLYELLKASVLGRHTGFSEDHCTSYLYTLPYLFDLLISCLSISLFTAILNFGSRPVGSTQESEIVDLSRSVCSICGQQEPVVRVVPCNHTCVCQECSVGLIKDYSKCPKCRTLIQDLLKA